jgi:hypothetical protein
MDVLICVPFGEGVQMELRELIRALETQADIDEVE